MQVPATGRVTSSEGTLVGHHVSSVYDIDMHLSKRRNIIGGTSGISFLEFKDILKYGGVGPSVEGHTKQSWKIEEYK